MKIATMKTEGEADERYLAAVAQLGEAAAQVSDPAVKQALQALGELIALTNEYVGNLAILALQDDTEEEE